MTLDLIFICIMALGALLLTVLPSLFNLSHPKEKNDRIAKFIFILTSLAVLFLTIFIGINTYKDQINKPYEFDIQKVTMTIVLDCSHCSDSDIDSIKSLPTQFTAKDIYLGSLKLSCDFNRIETPVKISGPRSSKRIIYYRSSYMTFENKKNPYEYLWDLNEEDVMLHLPKDFNMLANDTSKHYKISWWSGSLSVEVGKISIGVGNLNFNNKIFGNPFFKFRIKKSI